MGSATAGGVSLPKVVGSLLDDKGRTQEEAVATSGGACDNSFSLENLREQQAKNTANLGTNTASPGKGAKRRKKKKPSAKKASQDRSQRSLEQQGQKPAATHLRSLEKPRIIDELVGAAEEEKQDSLSNIAKQNLSLRILLTLSLRSKWLITTTRATEACSQDALGQQLRSIGLEQNKIEPSIFSGDELLILVDQRSILIGGTELQQECFFCELSALVRNQKKGVLAKGVFAEIRRFSSHCCSCTVCTATWHPMCPLVNSPYLSALLVCLSSICSKGCHVSWRQARYRTTCKLAEPKYSTAFDKNEKPRLCRSRVCLCRLTAM